MAGQEEHVYTVENKERVSELILLQVDRSVSHKCEREKVGDLGVGKSSVPAIAKEVEEKPFCSGCMTRSKS